MISLSLMMMRLEGAFDPPQGAQDAAAVFRRSRQKVRNDLAVGRRLENRTFAFQFVAQDGRH